MELALLMLYCGSEDMLFSVEWHDECLMGDIRGVVSGLSCPGGPVEIDIEVFSFNASSEDMQLISCCVSADEDDAVFCSQGEGS